MKSVSVKWPGTDKAVPLPAVPTVAKDRARTSVIRVPDIVMTDALTDGTETSALLAVPQDARIPCVTDSQDSVPRVELAIQETNVQSAGMDTTKPTVTHVKAAAQIVWHRAVIVQQEDAMAVLTAGTERSA